jgi:two-component system, NarL family, sensor histidine kinase DesK
MKDDSTDSAQGLRQLATGNRWPGLGGLPYVYLVFLVYLFIDPATGEDGTAVVWALTIGSIAVFLPLYFGQFRRPTAGSPRALWLNIGMATLGFALVPFNSGASTYVIYAAAGSGFVLRPRHALAYLGLLAAGLLVESWLVGPGFGLTMALPMIGLVATIGGVNIYQAERIRHDATLRLAQEDVEEMAKVAERERIARDLHDVLGHTLSVITLKAELASKLADRDPARAIDEIRDVEQISRRALTEVRQAIEGYHQRGLQGELSAATRALDAAGVRLESAIAPLDLPPRTEAALALALREAVTNVVRHARATRCAVRLRADGRQITLRIEDDGRGGAMSEGSGLAGMRKRVADLGGTVHIEHDAGLRLVISVPVAAAGAAS